MRERLDRIGFRVSRTDALKTDIEPDTRSLVKLPVYQLSEENGKRRLIKEEVQQIYIPHFERKDLFSVVINSDSMSPRFNRKDVIVFSETAHVSDGEFALVHDANDEYTLAKVSFIDGSVVLSFLNPKYPAVVLNNKNVQKCLRVMMRIEHF